MENTDILTSTLLFTERALIISMARAIGARSVAAKLGNVRTENVDKRRHDFALMSMLVIAEPAANVCSCADASHIRDDIRDACH